MSCGPRALALLCLRDRPLKGPGQMAESHWFPESHSFLLLARYLLPAPRAAGTAEVPLLILR